MIDNIRYILSTNAIHFSDGNPSQWMLHWAYSRLELDLMTKPFNIAYNVGANRIGNFWAIWWFATIPFEGGGEGGLYLKLQSSFSPSIRKPNRWTRHNRKTSSFHFLDQTYWTYETYFSWTFNSIPSSEEYQRQPIRTSVLNYLT